MAHYSFHDKIVFCFCFLILFYLGDVARSEGRHEGVGRWVIGVHDVKATKEAIKSLKNKTSHKKSWKGSKEQCTLIYFWWHHRFVQAMWKSALWFLEKLKIQLLCDPTITASGYEFYVNRPQRHLYISVCWSTIHNS